MQGFYLYRNAVDELTNGNFYSSAYQKAIVGFLMILDLEHIEPVAFVDFEEKQLSRRSYSEFQFNLTYDFVKFLE